MLALGSQTLHRSAWTHHPSNPTTQQTPTCRHPMHMHKSYRQNTLQHHCQVTYGNMRPKSGNLLIIGFTLLFVLCICLPTNKQTWQCL